MVRPFLKQLANPLEPVRLPRWLAGHVYTCDDCQRKYKSLEEFRDKVDQDADARDIDLACFPASRWYHDIARCNLQSPPPVSTYLHVRNCPACTEHIRQLYYRLDLDVPEFGTPEFEHLRLRVSKGSSPLLPVAPSTSLGKADRISSPEFIQLRAHLR